MDTTAKLAGRVALVTGASSGIGRATARTLAENGAAVVACARREDRLASLVRTIETSGGRAVARRTDVTRRRQVEAAVRTAVEAFGHLDILVNNAGVMPLSPLEAVRIEEWERMVDVNIKGVLYGIGAALPVMLEQGAGHVVNVGSVAGRRPFPGGTVYAATKFAVRAISAGMQLELSAARGIRVTDIQPGVVDTELTDHIEAPGVREAFRSRWEGRRSLTPEDVAAAVLYAVTAPAHVNVNEILVRPTDQPT